MQRDQKVFEIVKGLYLGEEGWDIGRWMWHNHVQWVAHKAKELAEKYEANSEKVYCAALVHDLADYKIERTEKDFNNQSETKGIEVLSEANFTPEEITEILEIIVRPHSCRPGNLPTTTEGKVLATADALFHIKTSFFPLFCNRQRPQRTKNYEEWQRWFDEKIERDFGVKIFFEDEKEEVKKDYEALKRVFGNKSLDGREE